MRIQITLLSLAAAIALSPSTVFAQDKEKKTKEKSEIQKAIEGLDRQGKGGLGNENDNKILKDLEQQEKPESKPASGDSTPASGDKTSAGQQQQAK